MYQKNFKSEQIKDSFLGITPPALSWIKFDLLSYENRDKKTANLLSADFVLQIKVGEKLSLPDADFNKKFMEATGLKFPAFNYDGSFYKFYTSTYTGDLEKKKDILKKLFEISAELDDRKKDFTFEEKQFLEDVKKNGFLYEDEDLVIKYNDKINEFIGVFKGFAGTDLYRRVTNFALTRRLFNYNDLPSELLTSTPFDFFSDNKIKDLRKKQVLLVNKNCLSGLKEFIEVRKLEKEKEVIEKEKAYKESQVDFSSLDIEEENPFDFKLKFNIEKKCFEFYCSGLSGILKEGNAFGNFPSLGSFSFLQKYVKNKILSKDLEGLEKDLSNKNFGLSKHGFFYHKETFAIKTIKGGSLKEKMVFVPMSEFQTLKEIKEHYLQEREWGVLFREKKTIKIKSNRELYVDEEKNSFIYIDGAKLYWVLSTTGRFNQKTSMFDYSFKGVEISKEEMNFIFEKNEFGDIIRKNTLTTNVNLLYRDTLDATPVTDELKEEVFNKKMMEHDILKTYAVQSGRKKKKI